MELKTTGDAKAVRDEVEIRLEVEEMEEVIAPGIHRNHNETVVDDEEISLEVEEVEEVIAPHIGTHPYNHNETIVADVCD